MKYIEVLNDILNSTNVTVGGGSASALSGAMASGLIAMVLRISVKKDLGLKDEKYIELSDELDAINKKLLDGSYQDTQAYLLIKGAFQMPRSTEEEKQLRKKAINDAGVSAADVPMQNAILMKRVVEIAEEVEGKYNENAKSDFVIGKELATLGIKGCLMNIEANLSLIKDDNKKQEFIDFIEKNK